MNDKQYSASEAKRLLEELAPYFAKLEKQTIEDLVIAAKDRSTDTDRRHTCLMERLLVLRDLESQLRAVILAGAQSVTRQKYVA
jgi:hypothetical protein